MRLSRILTRDLRGSASLRVFREWQIAFADQGRGIAITGRQVSARVEAPPPLGQLAKIEESRDTSAMFPVLLSDSGMIVAAGASTREEDLNFAVRKAQAMIASAPMPENEKARHQLYLAQLQRSGASLLDQMPPDLFFPDERDVKSIQEISLPGDLIGEFELTYNAFTKPGAAWLLRAMREVVTRIGSDERRSIEEWTMEALADNPEQQR